MSEFNLYLATAQKCNGLLRNDAFRNLRNVWIAVRDKLEVKLVAEKLPGIKLTAKIQTVPINASVKID